MKKNVVITGATGFIGRHLCRVLKKKGYAVIAVSRNRQKARNILGSNVSYCGYNITGLAACLEKSFCVINLAGDNIASGRWTETKKEKILKSRVHTGKLLTAALKKCAKKPAVFIQASATGFYGGRGEEMLTEKSGKGRGFLADVCSRWEKSTKNAGSEKTRHIIIRTGIALGKTGGMLPKLVLPFKFFAGAVLGKGTQWVSWIDIKDWTGAALHIMENKKISGPVNLTAPAPIPNSELAHVLGKKLKRPVFFRMPSFIIKLFFGDMGKELILFGQKVIPKKLMDAGYKFKYPNIDMSLRKNLKN